MKPRTAIVVVGLGAFGVWLFTRPGGVLGLINDLGLGQTAINSGLLTEEQITALIGMNPHLTTSQRVISYTATGASIGSVVPGWGTLIGAGLGALYGWIASSRNITLKDRIEFARRLGMTRDLCARCNEGWDDDRAVLEALFEGLDAIGHHDLVDTAQNQIGHADYDGNQQWMRNVVLALQTAGFRFTA